MSDGMDRSAKLVCDDDEADDVVEGDDVRSCCRVSLGHRVCSHTASIMTLIAEGDLMKAEDISHAVSHALRHEPEKYGLTLESDGWVEIGALIAGLHSRGAAWRGVDRAALDDMIATATKQRFEVSGSKIRAFYGHSVETRIERPVTAPPAELFHGTSPEAWAQIQVEGLRPMNRQSVHLSVDRETAIIVGRRKSSAPVILTVDAQSAHRAGVSFSRGNENVWVADAIESKFIRRE
jgi:putative RNA 2'-phosphotransferase